ncbi:MAG: hypothetical protein IPJ69_09650 [Deltaproteobacteria bacterium]|nr:MAG: hypothetical protein IPJ69_09650 [Deltaproteobacteria bacterium]
MKTLLSLISLILLSSTLLAVEPDLHDPQMLQAITNMRQRQEGEEGSTVRVIQQPIVTRVEQGCTLSEQARQRIRDLGSEKHTIGNVNVEAGHGEVTIDGNSGTINNSVNVQVVNNNDRKCF